MVKITSDFSKELQISDFKSNIAFLFKFTLSQNNFDK